MKQATISQILFSNGTPLRALPRHLMPNLGTLLAVAVMLFASRAWAMPTTLAPDAVPGIISYQGTLTTPAGQPVNGSVNMTFRFYNVPTGGTALWTEARTGSNAVPVSDGLFNVMLGSLTPIPSSVWSNSTLYLGVRVGSDAEMTPREIVGAVPTAFSVPAGAIGTTQIADGAVTSSKLSRHFSKVVATSNVPMPTQSTWYDILSLDINLDQENLVTIYASAAPQNNSGDTFFRTSVVVDGNEVILSDQWNKAGIGEQLMMSTVVSLGPGQHQITLRATSWADGGFVNGDGRTQLSVIEG